MPGGEHDRAEAQASIGQTRPAAAEAGRPAACPATPHHPRPQAQPGTAARALTMTCHDPRHRHGCPDAGWYRPGPDGWQPVSHADVWQYEDAANFMSDPRQNARAHHPLPPAEVGAEGRYLGRCSCGWRGQIPYSFESGANADTTAHIQEIRHGKPAHEPHSQGR